MMKFVAVVALVAIAASLVSAAGSISVVECEGDAMCKVGCRSISKLVAGSCHAEHFGPDSADRSFEAVCAPAKAGAKCVYGGVFRINETDRSSSCTDANTVGLRLEQCGVCFTNHMGHRMVFSNCNVAGNLTMQIGCNWDCSTCNHTYTVPEKKCMTIKEYPIAFEYGTPINCPGNINIVHWNTSNTCEGPAAKKLSFFQKACYSRGAKKSHYYTCNN